MTKEACHGNLILRAVGKILLPPSVELSAEIDKNGFLYVPLTEEAVRNVVKAYMGDCEEITVHFKTCVLIREIGLYKILVREDLPMGDPNFPGKFLRETEHSLWVVGHQNEN